MRYDYVVILKRDNERSINRISLGLCFLSMLAFVYQQIRNDQFSIFLSLAVVIVGTGMALSHVMARKGKKLNYKTGLLLAGVFWLGMPYLKWVSIIFFLLAFLENQARYPLEIGFTQNHILINDLIKKKYAWHEFNNIVLKDGLLTLDFANNRIFQRETLEDDEPDADEDEFNEYCQKKLKARSDNPFQMAGKG